MFRRVEMLGRVFVFRAVTTAHMATVQAHTQVDPGVANLQALFTTLSVWADVADCVEMRALLHHTSKRDAVAVWTGAVDVGEGLVVSTTFRSGHD